jgi:sigma-E factor negative regulatory protein RseC
MAQEKGLVTSITEDGWAQVETDRNDACSHCGSCRVSFGCNSEMTIKALNRAGAGVGDLVSIHLSSGTIMKSAAILYLIPVAGLISGAFMGEGLSTRLAMSEAPRASARGILAKASKNIHLLCELRATCEDVSS